MLYAALVLSAICWLITLRAMNKPHRPIAGSVVLCIVISCIPLMLMTQLHFVWLVIIVLALLMNIWKWCGFSSRSYTYASLLGFFGAFAGCGVPAYQDVIEAQRDYPLIKMEDRLPKAQSLNQDYSKINENPQLSVLATANLKGVEERYERPEENFVWEKRLAFRDLHEHVFHVFAMSPRFGASRMPLTFAMLYRMKYANEKEVVKFESSFLPMALSLSEVEHLPVPPFIAFSDWLIDSILRFVPIASLGYQAPDKRVTGFFAHGRKDYARKPDGWNASANKEYDKFRVRRLELISLLLHERPVAYQSDYLPDMDNVKDLKVRPLDAFESVGLLKLRAGEDLFVKEYEGRTLVLGALRNAKQCQACHEGERGKLLGAFSYDLMRTK